MKRPALQPLPNVENDQSSTPDRLVEAAGEIFAEHGFQNATVREICQRAEANIAAVNYHFGDKRGLYHAVFHYAHSCASADDVKGPLHGEPPAPADRLRRYVHALLARLLDEGRPAWHGKLMAREMVEPTGVLDDLIERSIRPHFEALERLIRDLLGAQAPADRVRRCATSIIGQCVFYRNSRPIFMRLDPQLRYTSDQVDLLAAHISEFSLHGMAAFAAPRREPMGKTQASPRDRSAVAAGRPRSPANGGRKP